ncbi:MAG: hypothetical protein Q7T73_16855 [Beijerinckiaceae bacterium]|nr:hypothetical protein [Beijerinckiaceae bacterium]
MKVLDARVRDGRLVIVVEAPAETSLYDLAAAEAAIGEALGCEVDVVTEAMLPAVQREGNYRTAPIAG